MSRLIQIGSIAAERRRSGGGGGGSAYKAAILADTPSAYWRLGEPSGTTAVDEIAAFNGAYVSGTTLGTTSLITDTPADTAMTVAAGSAKGMSLASVGSLNFNTGTVEAWVRPTGIGTGFRAIVVKDNAWGLFVHNNHFITYNWSAGAEHDSGLYAPGGPHHVVFVFDSGVSNGSKLYIDGVLVGSAYTHTVQSQVAASVHVGCALSASQELDGVVDEVAIYNYKLTAGQVAAHYSAGVGTTYGAHIAQDRPVLYLPMNELSGTNVANSGSLGAAGDATLHGSVTQGVSSRTNLGTAYTFGGTTSDYLTIPDNAALDLTNLMTYECWVAITTYGRFHMLMGKGSDGTSKGWVLYLQNGTGKIVLEQAGLTAPIVAASGIVPNDGVLHHVVVTMDATTPLCAAYLDGAQVFTAATSLTATANNADFEVGACNYAGSGPFDPMIGKMDEVAVYNYPLTPGQVLMHYNSGI